MIQKSRKQTSEKRSRPKTTAKTDADWVAAHVAKRSEIGDLPKWSDAKTTKRIIADPVWACWHYFSEWFTRPPSELTRAVIERIWNVMLHGGYQSIGIHRGGGKSTITKALLTLAGLCGIVKYAVCFGSSKQTAMQIRRDIIFQLENNKRLLKDFPAACIPIRALTGRPQRAPGQMYHGERTYIRYEGDTFQLARIPGAKSSGFLLKCIGIDAGFLGLVDNGTRPDFVLGDDIQSLDTAASDDMVRSLEQSVRQGIQGLGGKTNPLRIVMLATCTRQNDFSDRILNHEVYPEYSGFRPGFVQSWGKHPELWEDYVEAWKQDQRDGDKRFSKATSLYKSRRDEMDAGVVVSDPDFFVQGLEISAIQAAWNMRITMTDADYFAQIENRPVSPSATLYDLSPSVMKTNGLDPLRLPEWATGVTVFSDIGNEKFHWAMKCYGSMMRSAVIAYDRYPRRGAVIDGDMTEQEKRSRIWAALAELCDQWSQCVCLRGNEPVRIFVAGFDRGYEAESVQGFCASRSMSYPFPVIPCKGSGWKQWRPNSRHTIRQGWNTAMVRTSDGYAPGDFISVRTDFWKEVVQRSWLCASPDAPGACSVWGRDPRPHGEYFDHICAEKLVFKGKGFGGADMWDFRQKPGSQNHWLDATVGCDALAAYFGLIRPDDEQTGSGAVPQAETQNRRAVEQQASARRVPTVAMDEY